MPFIRMLFVLLFVVISCEATSGVIQGSCLSGCYINDTIVDSGQISHVNPCQICNPSSNVGQWSNAIAQTSCQTDSVIGGCDGLGHCIPTILTGVVTDPAGLTPLSNVSVYIPTSSISPFSSGISCGTSQISGNPSISAKTGVDGKFTLSNVPVGKNIPVVIQSGRWRRQFSINIDSVGMVNSVPNGILSMPKNKSEGDIPKIAIVTGSGDMIECLLRKIGIDDAEFSNPSGTSRIQLFLGSSSPGAQINASTPSEQSLLSSITSLENYDIVMLPCQSTAATITQSNYTNLNNYANMGGRIFASHYSYTYLTSGTNSNSFYSTATWNLGQSLNNSAVSAVMDSLNNPEGSSLIKWMQSNGSTIGNTVLISSPRWDLTAVNSSTSHQWMTANPTGTSQTLPIQFSFPTPVGSSMSASCGRVVFSDTHVENPSISPAGLVFPAECSNGALSPEEREMEFLIFDWNN